MHEYTMLIIGNVHDENREMYSQENTSEDLVAFRCADLDDVPIGIPSVGGDRLLDNPLGPSPIPSAFPAAAMFLLVISLHKYYIISLSIAIVVLNPPSKFVLKCLL
jgi:hypothetical protein